MDFNVKISELMTSKCSTENKIIRLSKAIRNNLNVESGEFVTLNSLNGPLTLQVSTAFIHDNINQDECAFVTRDIFDLLDDNKNQEIAVVKNVTLGTDPEFFIVKDGNILNPSKYFNKHDMCGHDGMLAELRPLPSLNSTKVAENIKALLMQAKNKINQMEPKANLLAYSHYKGTTAGFHLHYGIPQALLGKQHINKLLIGLLVRVMDYYVAIPSIIPEGHSDSGRRCAPLLSYGKIGDYRIDERTLEYRVPGGNLLRHPILTNGLLALGATVIEDALSRFAISTENFNSKVVLTYENLKDIYSDIPDPSELYQIVCVPSIDPAKKHINFIMDDVRSMVSYGKRKNIIEEFFSHLETQFSNNLSDNWNLNSKSIGE
jgi:hypothetical protein